MMRHYFFLVRRLLLVRPQSPVQCVVARPPSLFFCSSTSNRQEGGVSNKADLPDDDPPSSASTTDDAAKKKKTVPITFVEADGTEKVVSAVVGQNLLQAAHDNNVELEGACGGELACSTCHLIFPPEIYETLPAKLDDEEDMLDLAFAVTETSRLGCQIIVREDFAGMKVQIPDDGF